MEPTTIVDLQPLLDYGLEIVGVAFAAVATVFTAWIGKKFKDLTGVKLEDEQRKAVQDALAWAVNFGLNKARDRYDGKVKIDAKNEIVAFGAGYLADSVPTTLKRFGIDPNTVEGRQRIMDMVEARLDNWMFDKDEDENGSVVNQPSS